MQFCTGVLAVPDRSFCGGYCGNNILPDDGRRVDESEQCGMGTIQCGMGTCDCACDGAAL